MGNLSLPGQDASLTLAFLPAKAGIHFHLDGMKKVMYEFPILKFHSCLIYSCIFEWQRTLDPKDDPFYLIKMNPASYVFILFIHVAFLNLLSHSNKYKQNVQDLDLRTCDCNQTRLSLSVSSFNIPYLFLYSFSTRRNTHFLQRLVNEIH